MDPQAGTPVNMDDFTTASVSTTLILNEKEGDATFLSTPSTMDTQRKYEFFSKKHTASELHFVTLREYYKNKRIPRGMRSQLRPNLFTQDSTFKTCFEEISNQYGLDIILLNLRYLQKDIKETSVKKCESEATLQTLMSPEEFSRFMTKHTSFLAKFRADLEEVKRRKWQRDLQDYQTGFVYMWNNYKNMPTSNKNASFNYKNNRKMRDDKKTDRNVEDTSVFLDLPPTANSDQNLPGEADRATQVPQKAKLAEPRERRAKHRTTRIKATREV